MTEGYVIQCILRVSIGTHQGNDSRRSRNSATVPAPASLFGISAPAFGLAQRTRCWTHHSAREIDAAVKRRNMADSIAHPDHFRSSSLEFLTDRRGRYHEAFFPEKRNALEVLGVSVIIHPLQEGNAYAETDTSSEDGWLTTREAGTVMGVHQKTVYFYVRTWQLQTRTIKEGRLQVRLTDLPLLQEAGQVGITQKKQCGAGLRFPTRRVSSAYPRHRTRPRRDQIDR